MNKNWPTKDEDMTSAQRIMEKYAREKNVDSLGLFELIVNPEEKRMDFRLSSWVILVAEHFKSVYGPHQGDFITRQVISRYITQDQTLH